MVSRFLLRCLLLAAPIAIGTVLYAWLNKRYLPAPRVTPNFAINEKLLLTRRAEGTGVDVLALGSSMALNNLRSAEVVRHFGTDRYLNLGAWGTGMGALCLTGPAFVERLRPSTVIISTNLMDFAGADMMASLDSADIVDFLDRRNLAMDYLRHWNGPYYLRQIESNHVRMNDVGNYEYFVLDAHGGSLLHVPPERIDHQRYDKAPPAAEALIERDYDLLAAFADRLRQLGIHLIVLQNAYRDGVRTPASDSLQAMHVQRLRGILEPMGHELVDANAAQWSDDLYVDSSHLRADGAERFTRYCMERLRPR